MSHSTSESIFGAKSDRTLLGGAPPQDAAGQAPETLCDVWIIRASTIMDNTDFRALVPGVPHALGQLQMGNGRAISPFLMGLT